MPPELLADALDDADDEVEAHHRHDEDGHGLERRGGGGDQSAGVRSRGLHAGLDAEEQSAGQRQLAEDVVFHMMMSCGTGNEKCSVERLSAVLQRSYAA